MGVAALLDRIDPGTHRRIKGLRLVTAFGIAWLAGTQQGQALALSGRPPLGALAAGFALWASVSEAQTTRGASSRDLALLVLAAMAGAAMMIVLAPLLALTVGAAAPSLHWSRAPFWSAISGATACSARVSVRRSLSANCWLTAPG
jgi:hypothetical protein